MTPLQLSPAVIVSAARAAITLHAYLEWAATVPWGFGGIGCQDCTIFASDWALAKCGRDPGEGIRGTYSTEAGAFRIIRRGGGMEAFIGRQLERIGWRHVEAPQDGDIGVVWTITERGRELMPAIRAGGLWVGRNSWGQGAGAYEHVAAWRD
jgi:hypothetical protein